MTRVHLGCCQRSSWRKRISIRNDSTWHQKIRKHFAFAHAEREFSATRQEMSWKFLQLKEMFGLTQALRSKFRSFTKNRLLCGKSRSKSDIDFPDNESSSVVRFFRRRVKQQITSSFVLIANARWLIWTVFNEVSKYSSKHGTTQKLSSSAPSPLMCAEHV